MLKDHGSIQFGLGIYNQLAQVDFAWIYHQSSERLHVYIDGRELWRGRVEKDLLKVKELTPEVVLRGFDELYQDPQERAKVRENAWKFLPAVKLAIQAMDMKVAHIRTPFIQRRHADGVSEN